jgi:large subunit ribosomal protein L34e
MKQKKSRQGLRILKKRTPKGRNVRHYVKQKPDQAMCTRCSARLQGIPREIPSVLRHMSRSQRTVSRKFGGVLCNTCVRESEKYKTRMEDGYAVKRDLTIEKFLPKGWFSSLPKKTREASKAVVTSRKVELKIVEEVAEAVEEPTAEETAALEAEKPKAKKKTKAEE